MMVTSDDDPGSNRGLELERSDDVALGPGRASASGDKVPKVRASRM